MTKVICHCCEQEQEISEELNILSKFTFHCSKCFFVNPRDKETFAIVHPWHLWHDELFYRGANWLNKLYKRFNEFWEKWRHHENSSTNIKISAK